MKKYIPSIGVLAVLLVLALSFSIIHGALVHADGALGTFSKANLAQKGNTSSHSLTLTPPMAFTPACSAPAAGSAHCMAMVSTTTVQPTFASPTMPFGLGGGAHPLAAVGSAAPYSPTALHNAYNLPTTVAAAQTIAIIDAYDNPNAEADLATYRAMFGLPACTTANGCFKKVNQTGGTTYPAPNTGWGVETSLDLDMASAICQNCNLLLVEATTASFTDLGTAVNEAATLGANEISNSYGATEAAGVDALCSMFYTHPGIAVTASSGDSGLGVSFPADCPNVAGVGGTTLNTNGTETAWNTSATSGAGGGCSAQIALPPWQVQTVTNCANRAVSDVSAVADPNTGVFIIDTFGQAGGLQVGGTSVSAPLIAATFALAGGTAGTASSAIVPWTKNSAGCLNTIGGVYAFQVGLGSPNGIACF